MDWSQYAREAPQLNDEHQRNKDTISQENIRMKVMDIATARRAIRTCAVILSSVFMAHLLLTSRTAASSLEHDAQGMQLVKEGEFSMGDSFGDNESDPDETPVHTVFVSAFKMDKCEVRDDLWQQVYDWGGAHGYDFASSAGGGGWSTNHPVVYVSWFEAVQWCNARSQMEGLTPCYYTDTNKTAVYKSGRMNLSAEQVLWSADGYRLPTEAEWEKAARGNRVDKRFSTGNTLSHEDANYFAATNSVYDKSDTLGYHPRWNHTGRPCTSVVGSFPTNGLGLCDMTGNVSEWCWDQYLQSWYKDPKASVKNTKGPVIRKDGEVRVVRGGSWLGDAYEQRCSRRIGVRGDMVRDDLGFRCVRRLTHEPNPIMPQQTNQVNKTPAEKANGK